MEWLSAIRKAIAYIEEHLSEDVTAQDAAAHVYLSPMHFCSSSQIKPSVKFVKNG